LIDKRLYHRGVASQCGGDRVHGEGFSGVGCDQQEFQDTQIVVVWGDIGVGAHDF